MDGVHLPYQVLAQVISRRFKLTKKIENINGSHFLFIKNLKQQNFQFLHVETYLAFFTPKDKEPSLSSSEEKSSKFDWLERKRTRKKIYIYEKQSKCSVDIFLTMILLSSDYIYDLRWISFLYIGSKIYIEKIFFKKYPNNIFD